ncbi:hypothetical protein VXE65_02590 [Mycolicibacterium conceptionense]|uniref:hypothetical protein n=1 Tax=Mycolicibacterium conceptionense TaxID=451644 RepID=UPI003204A2C8
MSTNDDYTTVLVDPEHINVMIWAGLWLKEAQHNEPLAWPVLDELGQHRHLATLDNATADATGQMLLDTNARAVNNEQGRDQLYVYSYTPPRYRNWQVIEILRAIDFYTYQGAALDYWIYSEAYFFSSVLASRLVQQMPGYLSAAPHITTQTQPAMAKEWHAENRWSA